MEDKCPENIIDRVVAPHGFSFPSQSGIWGFPSSIPPSSIPPLPYPLFHTFLSARLPFFAMIFNWKGICTSPLPYFYQNNEDYYEV